MMKQLLKEASYRTFFLLDGLHVHVLPKHFYTPVPDYRWLKANRELWAGPASLHGVDWDLLAQLEWLEQICQPYYHEVAGLRLFEQIAASGVGPGFGPIESQLLHCFMRAKAPRRVIEIGSGVSTACMLHAISINQKESRETKVTCVEPFPREAFRGITSITHFEQPLQSLPLSVFDGMEAGDLLFIDSSHAVKTGSEVMRIYLDVIPALPPGVYVHVHDINLPYLYPRDALSAYYASQETALLLALLTNNRRLSILACLSGLHYSCPERLQAVMSDYQPQRNQDGLPAPEAAPGHFPSSIWLITH
jgi:predicted O-methyltransferase YrrM